MTKIGQIQEILGVEPDNKWGPASQAALEAAKRTAGYGLLTTEVPGWEHIHARIDDGDILITGAAVTCFGGASDAMDSGETASGISTKTHPNILACALPMRRDKSPHLRGSPIPKLPWQTAVQFIDPETDIKVMTVLLDEGPAKWTKHAGDLSIAAARVFDPRATANNFSAVLTIRIIGGAKFV